MNCSTPGLPVHHQLPEFTQTHVHRVGDAIQPSHPLLSPSPPAPSPSQYQKVKVKSLSHVRLFATLWTVAHQAPPSMGFSRQEYWSGVPFLSPGDLPDPGIKPRSPALQAGALTSEPPGKPTDDHYIYYCGQESLRRNGVATTVNKSPKCST